MEEVRNVIPESSGNYELTPEGIRVMCLVLIKNKQLKKFQSEELVDGYQLTFRDSQNPNCFINVRFKASANEKGNMFKALRKMSGNKLRKGVGATELFNTMMSCLGHWYQVAVEHVVSNGKTYANVTDYDIRPDLNADKDYGTNLTYFGNSPHELPGTTTNGTANDIPFPSNN